MKSRAHHGRRAPRSNAAVIPRSPAATGGSCFDRMADDSSWQAFTPAERRRVEAFARRWGIKPGDRVLEPGCGSGRLTEILAALTGPAGHVLAFDVSRALVRFARRRRLPRHVTLKVARAQTLRLAAGVYDHVVCFNVFPHLVPHTLCARRLVAALRPGGAFWIAHTRGRAHVNRAHRSGPEPIRGHVLSGPGELADLLRATGLAQIRIEDRAGWFLARAVRANPGNGSVMIGAYVE